MHSRKSKIILISIFIIGAAAATVLFYWPGNPDNSADIVSRQETLASGVSALSFSGRDENFGQTQDENFGQTQEVWFVHNGFLYQITAPSGNQEILEEMINSWKLNN